VTTPIPCHARSPLPSQPDVKFAGILNAYKRQPPRGHDRTKPPLGGN